LEKVDRLAAGDVAVLTVARNGSNMQSRGGTTKCGFGVRIKVELKPLNYSYSLSSGFYLEKFVHCFSPNLAQTFFLH